MNLTDTKRKEVLVIMKKGSMAGIVTAAVIYPLLFVLASSCGLIHPVCYAYAGTFLPLLMSFVYLYVTANMQRFGAAVLLNGVLLAVGLIAGEGNPALVVIIVVVTVIAELFRRMKGYETLKGVRLSFVPFAFSFYAYSAHWWTDTKGSLEAALKEMPAGYADKMAPVIANTPLLIVMLILTIPVAVLAVRIAERVMKKQTARLK